MRVALGYRGSTAAGIKVSAPRLERIVSAMRFSF
jgi:hypothetical protein